MPVLPGVPEPEVVPSGFAPVEPEVLVPPESWRAVVPVVVDTVHDEPSFMHLLGIGAEWRMSSAGLLHWLIDGEATCPGSA